MKEAEPDFLRDQQCRSPRRAFLPMLVRVSKKI